MIDCVKTARALSDPIRYRIMLMIARSNSRCCPPPGDGQRRGMCNCELMAATGMIQSRVSYHMKELVEAGLVIEEPRGRWKYYFVNLEALERFVGRLQDDFSLSDQGIVANRCQSVRMEEDVSDGRHTRDSA